MTAGAASVHTRRSLLYEVEVFEGRTGRGRPRNESPLPSLPFAKSIRMRSSPLP